MGPADVPGLPAVGPANAAAAVVAIVSPLEIGLGFEALRPRLGPVGSRGRESRGRSGWCWVPPRWSAWGSMVGVWLLVAGGRHVEPGSGAGGNKGGCETRAGRAEAGAEVAKARLGSPLAARSHGLGVQRAGARNWHLSRRRRSRSASSIRNGSVSIGAVLRSLGLTLDGVQRLTWASSDLAIWPERSVVVLELAPGHDTDALAHCGEAADVGMAGLPCRRMPGAAWPHPLVVVDRQTIVTGDEALLRALARRTDAHLESAPLDRLLAGRHPRRRRHAVARPGGGPGGPLETAHGAGWTCGRRRQHSWHDLWETPVGVGCTL